MIFQLRKAIRRWRFAHDLARCSCVKSRESCHRCTVSNFTIHVSGVPSVGWDPSYTSSGSLLKLFRERGHRS